MEYASVVKVLPGAGGHFAAMYRALWSLDSVPAATLELCRLRQAQLLRSDPALQHSEVDGLDAQRQELSDWPDSERFSAAEKACLELTEMHAMDVQAISDSQADAVKAAYGDEGYVALLQALGMFDALARLGMIWNLSTLEVN